MDNLSTIGSKSRRINTAKTQDFQDMRLKNQTKLSEINSSRLSRLINGETDLFDDEEIEGFNEFVNAEMTKKQKDELDLDSNLVLSHGVETREVMEGNNDKLIKALEWKEYRERFAKNTHLSRLQRDVYNAIRINDLKRLTDLGISDQLDLNFLIDLKPKKAYPPLILATVIGFAECVELILKNKSLNINAVDPENGANAFWYASFYSRAECMVLLAKAGIDIMSTSDKTHSNALHVAVQRQHYEIAKILMESGYPLNHSMSGGLTGLIMASSDKKFFKMCERIIETGGDLNKCTDDG